jgi:hypothetical protein
MSVVLIVELLCHDLSKNVPFTRAKSLIMHVKVFLPYFNAWIREFHQNWRVFTDVPGGSRQRQRLEPRGGAEDVTNDEDPNIGDDFDDMLLFVVA